MKWRVSMAIVALAGICVSIAPALAGPTPAMRSPKARAASPLGGADAIMLSNNLAGDGKLVVNPDAYGAYQTGYGSPGNDDVYDPAGPEPALSPMFAGALFIFDPATLDRASLAEATSSFPTNYPSSYALTVTSPQVGSDFDGDGVVDTSNSGFTVTGGAAGLNLSGTLLQRVFKPAAGSSVARFRQTWTLTNNGAAAANLKVLRHLDMDIFSTASPASFEDASGSVDAPGCQPITVYEREPSPLAPPNTPIVFGLSSRTPGYKYYAGRSGYDPDGAGPDPAMAYGTDFQIWNAYGLPVSWENETGWIGPAPATGEEPNQFPAGGVVPYDAFMGFQWSASIPPGGSQSFTTILSYGARSDYACYPDCNCDGALTVADFPCFQTSFVAGNTYADCNGDGVLTVADFPCFQTRFVAGCP